MYALPWHHADLSTATPAPLSLAVGRQIAVGDRKWLQLQWESQLSASSSTPPTGYHFIVQEKWRWHKQSPAASGNDPDGLHTPIVPPSTAILRSADTASAAVAPPSLPATAPLPATTSSLSASSASAAAAAAPPLQPPPYARPTQSTQQRAVARFPLLTPPIEDDSATGGGVDHGRWRTVYCGRFPQCGVGWYPGGSLAMFRVAVVNEARTTGPWSDVLTVKFPAVPLPPPIVLVTHDTSAVVRLQAPPWVFDHSTEVVEEPPVALPERKPPVAVVATCCGDPRRVDDHCWYPHYDPGEDRCDAPAA